MGKKGKERINGLEVLDEGTLYCPECDQVLEFELAGTMRVLRQVGQRFLYSARCIKHGQYYYVKKDKNS